jgi:hypothetical protein
MHELEVAQRLVMALLMMVTGGFGPPVGTGAFWITIGVWGVVSVLFDDETPRGIPGIEYLNQMRREPSQTGS